MFALAIAALILSHAVILLAGFFAPYSPSSQNRTLAFSAPTRLHFFDANHNFHLRPFVYRSLSVPGTFNDYQEDRTLAFPIRFFALGSPYKLFQFKTARHLFGTDAAARIFLLGTDGYGRDEFSRLLYGGRISLLAGLIATIISLTVGVAFGGLAGYHGKWIDDLIMRAAEVFLTIPWLYLLLSVRAFLPLRIDPNGIFLLLVVVLGIAGWARPARLIRGVVLSAKERDFVSAAKGFGASDFYILRKHILPHASGVIVTQMALYIPQYILLETTLSFFGLGVSEPAPSWGNMLAGLQQYSILQSCWWMFAPAAALVAVFLMYQQLFWRYTKGA